LTKKPLSFKCVARNENSREKKISSKIFGSLIKNLERERYKQSVCDISIVKIIEMKLVSRSIVLILFLCISKSEQNPEGDQVLQLIANAGYQGEVHFTETEDGYGLKIHRIVPKIYNGREPVIFMHGLLATAADFLISGRNVAIAYLLSDYGFDVYLGRS
jgi:hypothetical protein